MFVFLSTFLAGEFLSLVTGLEEKEKEKTKQTKKTKNQKQKNLLWGEKVLQKETCQTHNGLDRNMPMDELF